MINPLRNRRVGQIFHTLGLYNRYHSIWLCVPFGLVSMQSRWHLSRLNSGITYYIIKDRPTILLLSSCLTMHLDQKLKQEKRKDILKPGNQISQRRENQKSHCEMITTVTLIIVSSMQLQLVCVHVFVVRTLNINSTSKFQLYNTMLLTIATVLYIKPPELIYPT